MKRYLPLLILLLLISGCSTLPKHKEQNLEEISTALREVVVTASERIEAGLHAQTSLITLVPPSSSPLLDQAQIPRLDEHLQLWSKQVLAAFRQATIAMPALLKPYIEAMEFDNPIATRKLSESSASEALETQFRSEIEHDTRLMLGSYLSESKGTWELLTDRYAIWSRAKTLLGEQALPALGGDPDDYLVGLFLSTYRDQLAKEETYLRTTPVFQGTGSFYELLNQRAEP